MAFLFVSLKIKMTFNNFLMSVESHFCFLKTEFVIKFHVEQKLRLIEKIYPIPFLLQKMLPQCKLQQHFAYPMITWKE